MLREAVPNFGGIVAAALGDVNGASVALARGDFAGQQDAPNPG